MPRPHTHNSLRGRHAHLLRALACPRCKNMLPSCVCSGQLLARSRLTTCSSRFQLPGWRRLWLQCLTSEREKHAQLKKEKMREALAPSRSDRDLLVCCSIFCRVNRAAFCREICSCSSACSWLVQPRSITTRHTNHMRIEVGILFRKSVRAGVVASTATRMDALGATTRDSAHAMH